MTPPRPRRWSERFERSRHERAPGVADGVRRLRRAGRPLAVAVALVVGIMGGGAAGLVASGSAVPNTDPGGPIGGGSSPVPKVRILGASTLLVWTPRGLPAWFDRRVAALPGVEHAVGVWSGTLWARSAKAPNGATAIPLPRGMSVPIEVSAADLGSLAPFLAPADRSILPALAAGQAALGSTAASVLGLGLGATLQIGANPLSVAGVLPDQSVGAAEALVSLDTGRRLGIARERYAIVAAAPGAGTNRIAARIRALLPTGLPVQMRAPGETPWFRQGDAVLPPVVLDELFGSFAARPLSRGRIAVDPTWVAGNIVAVRLPLLGWVRCNRAIVPQLVGAFREIEREGLGHLIDRRGYGGCYRPAVTHPNDPQAGISHHTWGIAIDLNLPANRLGQTPHQDPRLVEIMERWGFGWGGRWLVPFGAQFEVVRLGAGS